MALRRAGGDAAPSLTRTLLALRGALLAHGAGGAAAWAAAALGLVSALATLLLGFAAAPRVGGTADLIALALALWMLGRIAVAALSGGDAALRVEYFRLLPIPRRRLARSLLLVSLADPALVLLALAAGSLVVLGARNGASATVGALAGLLLTVLLTGVLATLAGALVPADSRRRRDAGTLLIALATSAVTVLGALLPLLSSTLRQERSAGLSALLRALPSGWAADAVAAAARGDVALTPLPLAGLVAASAVAAAAWPRLLTRRLEGVVGSHRPARRRRRASAPAHHGRGARDDRAATGAAPAHPAGRTRDDRAATGAAPVLARRRALLPATPTGAVAAKELRLWSRDPLRSTCLLIAALVGVGVVPRASEGTDALLPYAGLLSVAIAGACACNLYGNDALALRLVAATPGSAAPDVRGRQLAWLLIVAPFAIVVSAALTAISGETAAVPWVAATLPALLGGGGLVPLSSVVAVQPLDAGGGPTPGWSLKVHVTLLAVALTALPALALLVAGVAADAPLLRWLAVPVGVATGVALALALGRVATRRLRRDQLDILARLAR